MSEATPPGPGPAQGREEGAAPGRPVTGLSALVYRDASRSRVLLGVRRRTATNARHPGVLSTPTIRLPAALHDLATTPAPPPCLPIGAGVHHLHPAIVLIEFLFARKLELGGPLTSGHFRAEAEMAHTLVDNVDDPLGTRHGEWTRLTTFEIVVTAGADLVPERSAAYSRLIWADTQRLVAAYRAHDALVVDETLDPFAVCIDGLCVRSAVSAIEVQG